jgi:hypothetical protein
MIVTLNDKRRKSVSSHALGRFETPYNLTNVNSINRRCGEEVKAITLIVMMTVIIAIIQLGFFIWLLVNNDKP